CGAAFALDPHNRKRGARVTGTGQWRKQGTSSNNNAKRFGQWFRRSPLVALIGTVLVTAVLTGEAGSGPQAAFPDVDIILIAEVHDSTGWLQIHQEVLGTPPDSSRPLNVTLPARTGGRRGLRVERPKFSVEIITHVGRSLLKIGVTGKVSAHEALGGLTPFEQAALEVQAGLVHNELSMVYGLSTVTGHLLELYLGRP
ncbi:MAG: hypothetical protein ACREA0_33745, partial [bacterium]